ncbi:MAG: ABC transporter permease, partial [Chloroflexi bacterium]|nr:ABC transporter permease [Chloroflexota bacterium]
ITTFFDTVQGQSALVDIVTEPVTAVTPKTEFDLYAPGMMIFAWLMLTPQTAMLVAREIRRGTLQRLHLTPMRAWDYLGGVTLAQLIVAIVQVIIVLFAARWMGFQGSGSLWQSGVVGIGVSMGAIGMGLVVANFVQNDSQAANLGSAISMIQVFLSGAFYALPPITIGTIAGHQMDLFDIFPATSGLLALQQLLTFGASLSDVVFRLGWVGVVTAVYFIVGVWLFQNNQTKVN